MLQKLLNRIEEFSEASLQKILILFCSGIVLIIFLCIYQAHYNQVTMINQLKKIVNNESKINLLLAKKNIIELEKSAMLKNREGSPDKDLLKIIEASAKEAEFDLGENYSSTFKQIPIPQESDFVEHQALLSSDKADLKKIITLINSLRKENFVMFREFKIENKANSPSFQVLLSMRQNK